MFELTLKQRLPHCRVESSHVLTTAYMTHPFMVSYYNVIMNNTVFIVTCIPPTQPTMQPTHTHTQSPTSLGSWDCVEREEGVGVRWVPDHSVSHCQGCGVEFWAGLRKHHCRFVHTHSDSTYCTRISPTTRS